MLELLLTLQQPSDVSNYELADGYIFGNHEVAVRIGYSFSLEEIKNLIDQIHQQNKKAYLNCNKLFTQADLEKNRTMIETLFTYHFDGVLFSDFAMVAIAKEMGIIDKLIYASETQIVNYFDIHTLFDEGIKSVIVSKEMTYENMLITAKKSSSRIGALVFGHYAMFYSKRKLICNFYQEYRLTHPNFESKLDFTIQEKTRNESLPIIQNQNGTTIFSHDILCAIEEVPSLIAAGVSLLIVDGIFMTSQQVKVTLGLFDEVRKSQRAITLSQIKEATGIENLSTGFLYKQIGLK
jgi:putative protease